MTKGEQPAGQLQMELLSHKVSEKWQELESSYLVVFVTLDVAEIREIMFPGVPQEMVDPCARERRVVVPVFLKKRGSSS